jgi:hypothetical protein
MAICCQRATDRQTIFVSAVFLCGGVEWGVHQGFTPAALVLEHSRVLKAMAMDIGSATSSPSLVQPQATALSGLQDAQARVSDGAEQLAAGNLDPAVVLSISSAQIDFAANAKVFEATQENTKRLLDMFA